MKLIVLPDMFAVCRLMPDQDIPDWALTRKSFLSITYTSEELSIVCPTEVVPVSIRCEKDWKALKVQGPLEFTLTGVLASLSTPLAEGKLPLFAVSTFDTDYLLVKKQNLSQAKYVLEQYGHTIALV
jgi:uncharacterized protein